MKGNALIPPGSTPEYELNRTRFLEYLYQVDGREDPTHPNHALYTGLAEECRQRIGQQVMDEIVTRWGEFEKELYDHLNAMRTSLQAECLPTS